MLYNSKKFVTGGGGGRKKHWGGGGVKTLGVGAKQNRSVDSYGKDSERNSKVPISAN